MRLPTRAQRHQGLVDRVCRCPRYIHHLVERVERVGGEGGLRGLLTERVQEGV